MRNNPAQADAVAQSIARVNAYLQKPDRDIESAKKHHARVEALCAVASVLIVQGVAALFFFQAIK
jgi:hypothetical protein